MNTAPMDFDAMVGQRIRLAREQESLTQQALADRLQFKDRQTLAQIETGSRKVTLEELNSIVAVLGKPYDYFTDPYLIVGKSLFNWRAANEDEAAVAEHAARPLLACYKRCRGILGESTYPFAQVLNIARTSPYSVAADLGDNVASVWQLGATPAAELPKVVEDKLHLLLLYMDLPGGVSGGACRLTEFSTVIVNRGHAKCRRAFTLAHELFHLLTWDAMTPEQRESPDYTFGMKSPHIERLADNFAAGLLMPRNSLEPRWKAFQGGDIHAWLTTTAAEYEVSTTALFWRLVNSRLMSQRQAEKVDRNRLGERAAPQREDAAKPKLYSRAFAEKLHAAIDKGFISVRKTAELLQCNIEDVGSLFDAYNMEPLFDL